MGDDKKDPRNAEVFFREEMSRLELGDLDSFRAFVAGFN